MQMVRRINHGEYISTVNILKMCTEYMYNIRAGF
jgi:hypothetical protein